MVVKLDPIIKRFTEVEYPENPKDGDIISYTNTKGHTYQKVYVVCPDCSSGRWRYKHSITEPGFTRLCNNCSNRDKELFSGDKNPNWRGGKSLTHSGYVRVFIGYDSPYYSMVKPVAKNRRGGYVLEHRLVMAKYLGRPLKSDEVLHHINGIKIDNRIENLRLYEGQNKHALTEREEITMLRTRVTQLEAEIVLLKAQLEKDGIT